MNFIYGKGAFAKTLPYQLKPFTLIGATTRAGLLTPPLRERFGMIYHLDYYSPKDLAKAGLDRLNRLYLKAIIEGYHGGPVGIEALAATLNEEVDTLVDVVEPFLLKIGFVTRRPGGRKIGKAAQAHLGLPYDDE